MSTMTVAVTYDLIAEAFALVNSADQAAPDAHSGASKLDSNADELAAAIEVAWIKITTLVEKCTSKGKTIIQDEVALLMQHVEETGERLRQHGKEFRQRLLEKVREMIGRTFDVMLKAMRSDIVVGNRKLVLKTLNLEQKLVFSGSLQVSLTSLCEFAGSGELTVTGTYELER